jgi:hypothetical protein
VLPVLGGEHQRQEAGRHQTRRSGDPPRSRQPCKAALSGGIR